MSFKQQGWQNLLTWLQRLATTPWLTRIGLGLAGLGLLGAILSLAAASGNNTLWLIYYEPLFWTNVALSALLLLVVALLLLRLLWRVRQGRFGARLTLRFALAFAVMSVVPGAVVYLTSILFLQQSMDSWFNVRLDPALNAGIELSRKAINDQLTELTQTTRTAAALAAQAPAGASDAQSSIEAILGGRAAPPAETPAQLLIRLKAQFKQVDISIVDERANVLADTGNTHTLGLLADAPSDPKDWQTLQKTGVLALVETLPESASAPTVERLALRAVVAIPSSASGAKPSARYVQFTQMLAPQVAQWSQTMSTALREVGTLELGRQGLRKIYGLTLTLTLLLAVLAAVTAGFVVADSMAAPLLRLARGTQAVAAGDFTPLKDSGSGDDLAVLTRSFNGMNLQLSQARDTLTHSSRYLAQVLESLSTGVLVIDARQQLRSINAAGVQVLGLAALPESESQTPISTPAALALPPALWGLLKDKPLDLPWDATLDMTPASGQVVSLVLRGTPLPQADGTRMLVVFDDVSDMMMAQKAQAWGEVASRLAHEIKNPLTPIQLSAERLQHKLAGKLGDLDADLLKRSTYTIVSQVNALQLMVNEFRQYARLPQARLQPMALNECLDEILNLYASTDKSSADKNCPIHIALNAQNDGFLGDAGQLRQVVHNLLGNAQDAALANTQGRAASVHILTRDSTRGLVLCIRDNGNGFSPQALAHLFEPYHTTKSQGTGLGLAIVQRIVQDHRARIQVKNSIDESATSPAITGAQVEIVFPVLANTPLKNSVSPSSALTQTPTILGTV